MIDEGKLRHIRTKGRDRATKVECIPKTEGIQIVAKTHKNNGHFRWDHTRLKLHDEWFWLGMDRDSKEVITECQ